MQHSSRCPSTIAIMIGLGCDWTAKTMLTNAQTLTLTWVRACMQSWTHTVTLTACMQRALKRAMVPVGDTKMSQLKRWKDSGGSLQEAQDAFRCAWRSAIEKLRRIMSCHDVIRSMMSSEYDLIRVRHPRAVIPRNDIVDDILKMSSFGCQPE